MSKSFKKPYLKYSDGHWLVIDCQGGVVGFDTMEDEASGFLLREEALYMAYAMSRDLEYCMCHLSSLDPDRSEFVTVGIRNWIT